MTITINGTTGISGVDGSAATPAFKGNDSNTGVSFGTDIVTINTGGTARVTTDASGNVGLGVTPSAWDTLRGLDIGSGGALWGTAAQVGVASNAYYGSGGFRYKATNVAAALQVDGNVFKFLTAPSGTAGNTISFTQAMTLDASGRQLIGITGNTAYETNTKSTLFTSGTGQVFNLLQLTNVGTPAEGNIVGIGFAAGETTQYGVKGSIGFVRTDIYGRGALTFYTNNTAGSESVSTANERMRIDSSGNLLVGTTSGTDFRLRVNRSGNLGICTLTNSDTSGLSYDQFQIIVGQSASSAYMLARWYVAAGASPQFAFRGDGQMFATTTSIASISDARVKENVRDADDGLQTILGLRTVRFDFKEGFGNNRKNQLGFIAQEVETVFSDAVDVAGVTTEDSDAYKSVAPGTLIPVLVKAIQEQQAIITQLQADVAALKGAA